MDTMNGPILDELIRMMEPVKDRYPVPRRRMREAVTGGIVALVAMVTMILLLVGIFLVFGKNS
jgi:hypothetical protein